MFSRKEKRGSSKKRLPNLYNLDECVSFFLKSQPSSTPTILNYVASQAFLEVIIGSIVNYANVTFERIKDHIRYPQNEQRPFIELWTDKEAKPILKTVEQLLKSRPDLKSYHSFFQFFEQLLEAVRYFVKFDEAFNNYSKDSTYYLEANPRLAYLEQLFEEYGNKAFELQELLVKTSYDPIILKLARYNLLTKKDKARLKEKTTLYEKIKQIEQEKKTRKASDENNIEKEVNVKREVEPTLIERFFDYLSSNTKKLISGGIVGGLIVAGASLLLLPLIGPAVIVPFVVSAFILGAAIGSSITGAIHRLFSSKKPPQPAVVKPVKVVESAEDKEKKSHLLVFFELLLHHAPLTIVETQNAMEMISNLKIILIGKKKRDLDPFELVKYYLLSKDENIFRDINFKKIKSIFENHTPSPFNIEKFMSMDELEFHYRSIKLQAILQMGKEEKIDFSKIKKLTQQEFVELERSSSSISPMNVAFLCFKNIKNREFIGHHLKLYFDLYPSQNENFVRECTRIKNVLGYFINRHRRDPIMTNNIDERTLVQEFLNTVNKMKTDDVVAVYLEILFTTSKELYNVEFFPRFIKESKQFHHPELLSKLEASLQESYFVKKTSLFNCLKLFLNAATENMESKFTETSSQELVNKFYKTLEVLNVEKVLLIFSELRFNTFLEQDLDSFKSRIQDYYGHTSPAKLKQFNEGILEFTNLVYINKNMLPRLNLIKMFLQKSGNVNANIAKPSFHESMNLFYEQLSNMEVSKIFATLKKASVVSFTMVQYRFWIQLLLNFFKVKRPGDLPALREHMTNFVAYAQQPMSFRVGSSAHSRQVPSEIPEVITPSLVVSR